MVLDSSSNCLGLTIYNLALSTHFSVGTILTIPDPPLREATLEHNVSNKQFFLLLSFLLQGEVVEFKNIQVTNPSRLLVNGHKIAPDKLALSSVSVTAFN